MTRSLGSLRKILSTFAAALDASSMVVKVDRIL